jgi:hypothetical protein
VNDIKVEPNASRLVSTKDAAANRKERQAEEIETFDPVDSVQFFSALIAL